MFILHVFLHLGFVTPVGSLDILLELYQNFYLFIHSFLNFILCWSTAY